MCSWFFSLQSYVREEDFWNRQQRPPPIPGQPLCVFPDTGACMFCYGVCSGRRSDDAYPRWRFLWAQSRVSDHSFNSVLIIHVHFLIVNHLVMRDLWGYLASPACRGLHYSFTEFDNTEILLISAGLFISYKNLASLCTLFPLHQFVFGKLSRFPSWFL